MLTTKRPKKEKKPKEAQNSLGTEDDLLPEVPEEEPTAELEAPAVAVPMEFTFEEEPQEETAEPEQEEQ